MSKQEELISRTGKIYTVKDEDMCYWSESYPSTNAVFLTWATSFFF